jgi:hypothetical protein
MRIVEKNVVKPLDFLTSEPVCNIVQMEVSLGGIYADYGE